MKQQAPTSPPPKTTPALLLLNRGPGGPGRRLRRELWPLSSLSSTWFEFYATSSPCLDDVLSPLPPSFFSQVQEEKKISSSGSPWCFCPNPTPSRPRPLLPEALVLPRSAKLRDFSSCLQIGGGRAGKVCMEKTRFLLPLFFSPQSRGSCCTRRDLGGGGDAVPGRELLTEIFATKTKI
ncbi:uncharacterized protein ACOB8E_004602 [Sarcophilus harrisii]